MQGQLIHCQLRRLAPLSHQCHRTPLALRQRAWLVNDHGTLSTLRLTLGDKGLLSELPVARPFPVAPVASLRGDLGGVRFGRFGCGAGVAVMLFLRPAPSIELVAAVCDRRSPTYESFRR